MLDWLAVTHGNWPVLLIWDHRFCAKTPCSVTEAFPYALPAQKLQRITSLCIFYFEGDTEKEKYISVQFIFAKSSAVMSHLLVMVELRWGYEVAHQGLERESVANWKGELQTPDVFASQYWCLTCEVDQGKAWQVSTAKDGTSAQSLHCTYTRYGFSVKAWDGKY